MPFSDHYKEKRNGVSGPRLQIGTTLSKIIKEIKFKKNTGEKIIVAADGEHLAD